MNRFAGLLLLSALFASVNVSHGQEAPAGVMSPPKVLVLFREFVKPGKTGATHEKTESAFVQAFTRANWPTHYFAVDSMTGRPRSLFLTGYESFEAYGKDAEAVQKNAALAAALDRAGVADGDLLSDADGHALIYREDYSLHASLNIAHMRYFAISTFRVKQGHRQDWDALVKMVLAGYEKIPDVHFATFESEYGSEDLTYVVFTPMQSLAEVDRGFAQDKQFEANLGQDGMKRFADLEAATIETSQSNLFSFNPRMSYPPPAWVQADPEFWSPKPAGTPPAKPAAKPKKP